MKYQEDRGRDLQMISKHDKHDYVVMVDYYSKFLEISHLPNSRSKTVVNHIKPNLARYGTPEIVVSDNGSEFSSYEFQEFAKYYGFKHTTAAPRYPQSNGLAKRAVQTAKNILTKAKSEKDDFHLSLLAYRNTPIEEI